MSFSAGSYGCMLMIMPMAVPIAYTMAYSNPAVQNPWGLFCACVASVLAGSISATTAPRDRHDDPFRHRAAAAPLLDHVKPRCPTP